MLPLPPIVDPSLMRTDSHVIWRGKPRPLASALLLRIELCVNSRMLVVRCSFSFSFGLLAFVWWLGQRLTLAARFGAMTTTLSTQSTIITEREALTELVQEIAIWRIPRTFVRAFDQYGRFDMWPLHDDLLSCRLRPSSKRTKRLILHRTSTRVHSRYL